MPPDAQARYPLPWSEMRGMRNVVAHAYFGVSLRIVWDTIQLNLPRMIPVLEQMLEEASRASGAEGPSFED